MHFGAEAQMLKFHGTHKNVCSRTSTYKMVTWSVNCNTFSANSNSATLAVESTLTL